MGHNGNIKWDYESVKEEASKYKSRSEFQKRCASAYRVALKNGWLDDFNWLVRPKRKVKWNYDSIKEEHFDFASVKVEPEIQLFAGLIFKDSISLFLSVKAEYDIGASGEISSSIEYNFDFQLKEKKLGLEINGKINPIKIKLEYHVVGGYTISSYKKSREFAGKTKEWKYLGHNMKSINWEIFDFNPN